MEITQDEINRFRASWKAEFSEEITEDDARFHIRRLDALYLMLARPSSAEKEPHDSEGSTTE